MGLQKLKIGILCLAMVGTQLALAEEETSSFSNTGESTTKLSDAIKQKQYDQSEKITDMELNAQAGSLSRYSGQAFFGYAGPAINDLGIGQTIGLNGPPPGYLTCPLGVD